MKRTLFILLFHFIFLAGNAQEKSRFALSTDRDLYTSGESILFKVFASSSINAGIVHVDLINTRGKIISGVTRKIVDHQANGFVDLPDSLSTGTYILSTSLKNSSLVILKELFIFNRFIGIANLNNILRLKPKERLVQKPSDMLLVDGLDQTYKTRGKANPEIHLSAELIDQINGKLLVSVVESCSGFSSGTFSRQTNSLVSKESENEGVVLEGIVRD